MLSIGKLKKTFKKSDLYYKYYLKSSLHKLYTRIFRYDLVETSKQVLKFNQSILVPNSLVFDIGANVGYKAEIYSKIGCQIIAVEPDPRNIKVLKRVFNNNKQVTVVEKAVSNKIGLEKIYISQQDSALTTFSDKWKSFLETQKERKLNQFVASPESYEISTTTLDSLIHQFGIPKYIKIDVEGYEFEALQGLTYPISLVSFEANLPEFREESINCILHLSKIKNDALFNYVLNDAKGFELEAWLDCRGIIEFLKATNLRYTEIYCKME